MTDHSKSNQLAIELNCEQSMIEFAGRLSVLIERLAEPLLIGLSGDLGAGKTTLCRGLLYGLGHSGAVKSPTYTLIEAYELAIGKVLHVDLYRLVDPQELECMGFIDYLHQSQLCLIEWPESGHGYLPKPELLIKIIPSKTGRYVTLVANKPCGKVLLEGMSSQ